MPGQISIDVFAATNPALGSLVLRQFLDGFCSIRTEGADFAILYLPLPILLPEELASTFDGTNRKTGFMAWISRSPIVPARLPHRLYLTTDFSRIAMEFGVRHGVIQLAPTGKFRPTAIGLFKKPTLPASNSVGKTFNLARRLGGWIAEIPAVATVYFSLGLTA